MTEPAPAAATMPACNGSLQLAAAIEEIPKSVGTVPYANADTSPDASPAKESLEETTNSLAEDITAENFAGEKRCQEKREENAGTLQQGAADAQDTGSNARGSGEGPGGTAGTGTETLPGGAEPRGTAEEAEEEEEEQEEQDTEEDEVQVIELKPGNSEGSRRQQPDSGQEPPLSPGSPGCNSPLEKAGEPPSLGKKNDISRHSYSRYNTISYRRIRKGNTKQRIDEFESMMHL
ncbi:ermin [Catharus ustulatus]|uniref:ermin n=1 Tax=Catharus ustulatus TaxID=91951 RepID=UPI00140E4668|nr:ermin [Catharus ustulatus]